MAVSGIVAHIAPFIPQKQQGILDEKIQNNQERDKRKIQELEIKGWKVLVVWECRIKHNLTTTIDDIQALYTEGGVDR